MRRRTAFLQLLTLPVAAGLVAAVGVRAGLAAGPAEQQSPPTLAERVAEMRHHFVEVTRIHEAVIRGDLAGVRAPAAALARIEAPPQLGEVARPFVAAIREAGRVAAVAPSLRSAARATVNALTQCAGCHRAASIFPGPVSARRPDVGGIVGHMLEHQRAADAMVQGLVIPSDSRWREGADRLDTLTLRPEKWPRDAKLTQQARQADAAIHRLAPRALEAGTAAERGDVYVELITTCANCHSLHRRVWGPQAK
jgi:hypothetical protein